MNANMVILAGTVESLDYMITPQGNSKTDIVLKTVVAQGSRSEAKPAYPTITAWGDRAKIAAAQLKKGSVIYMEGRISTYEIYDPSTNQPRTIVGIAVDRFQFIDKYDKKKYDPKAVKRKPTLDEVLPL